jgi:hypothetical protein
MPYLFRFDSIRFDSMAEHLLWEGGSLFPIATASAAAVGNDFCAISFLVDCHVPLLVSIQWRKCWCGRRGCSLFPIIWNNGRGGTVRVVRQEQTGASIDSSLVRRVASGKAIETRKQKSPIGIEELNNQR